MPAWTDATRSDRTGVVLRPEAFGRHAELCRYLCDVRLGRWVDYYWSVRWELPPGTSYLSSTVPEPNCHLSVEYGGRFRDGAVCDGVFLTGVASRRRFDVTLTGSGGVVGARFRPGGLTAMTGFEAWTLTDRVLPAGDVAPWAAGLAGLRVGAPDLQDRLDQALLRRVPDIRGDDQILRSSLRVLYADPTRSVAELAAACGVGVRRLQRVYRRGVGVGPQWVLARARVHAALARMHEGTEITLAGLAADLGWYDQAHFTRDFIALVGQPPGAYLQTHCSVRG